MGQRVVHQRRPQERERQKRAELHPVRDRAGDQRRRDDREHALKDHERLVRHGRRIVARLAADTDEPQPIEIADHAAHVRPEGEGIAPQHPLDAHHGHQNEALHDGRQCVLAPHQPAVEQGQARRGHHQDDRRTDQQPSGVAAVDRRGVLGPRRCRQRGKAEQTAGRGSRGTSGPRAHPLQIRHVDALLALTSRASVQAGVACPLSETPRRRGDSRLPARNLAICRGDLKQRFIEPALCRARSLRQAQRARVLACACDAGPSSSTGGMRSRRAYTPR